MDHNEDLMCDVISDCDYDSEYEIEDWSDTEDPDSRWLTARDPIFWCMAPAHLEEIAWLFRTAPPRQPKDSHGSPMTLLEYYIRMDVTELLNKLAQAPDRVHDRLCLMWSRVTKRRNLSRENGLKHSFGPELDWLFDRDPALPPSWAVSVQDRGDRAFEIFFPEWHGEGVFV